MLLKCEIGHSLTVAEQTAIDYINRNVDIIADLTISDIAERAFVSTSTVSRAIRKCGITSFLHIGYTAPFKLYINGELLAERRGCESWTAENVHLEKVKLKKGENRVVFRLTRVNADAKFNLTFSEGWTCATHVTGLVSKNPYNF